MLKGRIVNTTLILFALCWLTVIGLDYLNKHEFYYRSFKYFRFPNLFLFLASFITILSVLALKYNKVKGLIVSGLGLLSLWLLFTIVLGMSFSKYSLSPSLEANTILSYVSTVGSSLGYLLLLSLGAYMYGNLFPNTFLDNAILKIAIGLIVISCLFFALSAVWWLKPLPIIVVLIFPVLLNIRSIPSFLKQVTVQPYIIHKLSLFGLFSLLSLGFYLCLNFAYTQAPFPVGFDTRNLYMNISKQVAESQGLIFGYRPHYWELMMSTGFVIFKSSPVPLSISFYGYLLSIFAMFHLGVKSLKIDPNKVLFCILLFTVAPAISNQLYIELKTDFALLFYQLTAAIVFFSIFNHLVESKETSAINFSKTFKLSKSLIQMFGLLGVLIGFGLGIKMTNMFLLFTLVIALFWLIVDNLLATFSVVLLTMALFILVSLDDLSGVRIYHLGLNYTLIGCGLLGTLLFIWSLFKNRSQMLACIKMLSITGFFAMVTLSPWLIKNYNETKSLHPKTLLNGATAEPNINIQTLQRNYRNNGGR